MNLFLANLDDKFEKYYFGYKVWNGRIVSSSPIFIEPFKPFSNRFLNAF